SRPPGRLKVGAAMRTAHMLILAVVSGCAAPAYVAGRRPSVPEPDWAQHAEQRLQTNDGISLRVQTWRPLTGEPAAAVLIVHGLKDHSDRYAGFAKALVEAGFAVYALDLRGHGDSSGDRVWVARFDDYLDDVAQVLAQVKEP